MNVKSSSGAAPFAPRLWAESRIRTLQASAQPGGVIEIVELSKRFRVMSRETSWLVLESEQMFAEFGIPRSKPALEGAETGAEKSPAARAALAQELDSLGSIELGALGSIGPVGGSGGPASDVLSAPAAAAAPAPIAPPAAPRKPGSASGGLSGIGSAESESGAKSSEGSGSGGANVSGPRSLVSVGGAAVSGGTVANAARMAAGMRAGFRACHQRTLNENPDAAGTARLLINVAPSGAVSSVNLTPSGNLPASLVACVTARARATQFDSPEGGNATITIPITFARADGGTRPADSPRPPGALAPRPRLRPVDDVAVIRQGDELWLGQGQAALDKLQAELAASPESRKRHEAMVRGLLLRGRFAPALVAAERFVELDPDLPVARELLSYAAVATGDRKRAVAAIDAMAETAPTDIKTQGRAARAFEALSDEPRACAHWRSMFDLAPTSDAALFESLRCRARVLRDQAGALRDAKAVQRPGPLLQRLLPLLESGQIPAFEKSSGSAGQLEASLTCEPTQDCPYVIVITPSGTVFSPWTPALGRSSSTSFAFSGLLTGTYRVLLIGGTLSARGRVEVRALNARNVFDFAPGHPRTIAITQVTLADVRPGVGRLGIF